MTRIVSAFLIRLLVVSGTLPGLAAAVLAQEQSTARPAQERAQRAEEEQDYFRKWLKQDVVYIITPQEREIFEELTTDEEKERFIEQFWLRRDPDLLTAENEFKEEHYRRIAFANEHFYSGEPGWMTDRGRVYIIHGPPDQLESHPAGGAYYRPMHEGGGSTSTFPFEIWWYRYIEGIGSDIELEFVDRNGGNQFRLALDPNYKDALLHIQDAGQTLAEELGIANKADRPVFSPMNKDSYPLIYRREKDNPFVKYETFAAVQRPKEIKYKDLQQLVEVNISYNNLPFEVRQDHFDLNENQVIVPLTLEWDNKDLDFQPEGPDFVARLAVYGMVTSIRNHIVAEFEEEISTRLPGARFPRGPLGRSVYQKIVVLDKDVRYKLELVVKDLTNGNVGATRQAIIPQRFDPDTFTASTLILSDFVQKLNDVPKEDQMFVLGDLWIRPSIRKTFSLDQPLTAYLQVYHFGVDQTTLYPQIEAQFRIFRGSKPVLEVLDQGGESVHFFSGSRIVLLRQLPITLLNPGEYRLEVRVRDLVNNREVTSNAAFELKPPRS